MLHTEAVPNKTEAWPLGSYSLVDTYLPTVVSPSDALSQEILLARAIGMGLNVVVTPE